MLDLIRAFLSGQYAPHGYCLLWRPELIWTHVVSDVSITLSYLSISLALGYFVHRRRDIEFGSMFWLFALFIFACGISHLMAVWNLWHGDYGVEALVKAITALASVPTAFLLWRLIPAAMALQSPAQLQIANRALSDLVAQRDAAFDRLTLEVAQRQEAEAELGQARALAARDAQMRSILQSVPDAMVVVDEKGIIRDFSAAAERVWGYRSADMLGKGLETLAAQGGDGRFFALLKNYVETGRATPAGQPDMASAVDATGREFPVEIRVGVARSDDMLLVTMFFRDITARLAAEHRVSELQFQLAHVSRQSAMSELSTDLAHELNQPLSAASNFLASAKMLYARGGEDAARAVDMVDMGLEQTLRAGEIIRRMREFMANHENEARNEALDGLIRSTVDLMMIGKRALDLQLSVETDPDAQFVFADRIQVQQVLVNLLRNAVEVLQDQPVTQRRIMIRTRRLDPDWIEVEVADTGPGLPAPILDNLDSRFTTARPGGGMGIGLSISRRIVVSHGGVFTAENRPGGGATFRFTLPAAVDIPVE
jgi:two-component system sensor kinase FixL